MDLPLKIDFRPLLFFLCLINSFYRRYVFSMYSRSNRSNKSNRSNDRSNRFNRLNFFRLARWLATLIGHGHIYVYTYIYIYIYTYTYMGVSDSCCRPACQSDQIQSIKCNQSSGSIGSIVHTENIPPVK